MVIINELNFSGQWPDINKIVRYTYQNFQFKVKLVDYTDEKFNFSCKLNKEPETNFDADVQFIITNNNSSKSKIINQKIFFAKGSKKVNFSFDFPVSEIDVEHGWLKNGLFHMDFFYDDQTNDSDFSDDEAPINIFLIEINKKEKQIFSFDFSGDRFHLEYPYIKDDSFYITLLADRINQSYDLKFKFVLLNDSESKQKAETINKIFTKPGDNYKITFSNLKKSELFDLNNGYARPVDGIPQLALSIYVKKNKTSMLSTNIPMDKKSASNNNLFQQSKVMGSPLVSRELYREPAEFAGLQNQGSTCYMNSLLQALFHLPAFRKLIYKMPINDIQDHKTDVVWNLQRLFCQMQTSKKACSTRQLTISFGWDDKRTFIQHDIQEFCRVLLDNIEEKLKKNQKAEHSNQSSQVENQDEIADLMRGTCISYTRCINVPYESKHEDSFYDLSLTVKGCKDLDASFKKYVEKERLDGDNKYHADQYGLQEAEKWIEFLSLPKVLLLHLGRFEYVYQYNGYKKINDYFEFPKEINLEPFMDKNADHSIPYFYELYGVLVHSGTVQAGHYYAYLRPSTEPQWYEFNDSIVRKVPEESAINNNYGGLQSQGSQNNSLSRGPYYGSTNSLSQKSFSAYYLIYIRKDSASEIYQTLAEKDIPEQILQSVLNEEKNLQKPKIYKFETKVCPEESFAFNLLRNKTGFYGTPLEKTIELTNTDTTLEIYKKVSSLFSLPENEIRLFYYPSKSLFGSLSGLIEPNQTINSFILKDKSFFLQHKSKEEDYKIAPSKYLLFLKFFDQNKVSETCNTLQNDITTAYNNSPLKYIGSNTFENSLTLQDLCKYINDKLNFPEETPLLIFTESFNTSVKQLKNYQKQLLELPDVRQYQSLIFQIDPELPIPSYTFTYKYITNLNESYLNTKEFSTPDEKSNNNTNSTKEDKSEKLPMYEMELPKIKTVDQFFTRYINPALALTIFDYNRPSIPVFQITVPGDVKFSDFIQYIQKAILHIDVDPIQDTFLLYKKDFYLDIPNSFDLTNFGKFNNLQYMKDIYPSHSNMSQKMFLYYRYLPGITQSDLNRKQLLNIQISKDGYTIDKYGSIVVNKNATKVDILKEAFLKLYNEVIPEQEGGSTYCEYRILINVDSSSFAYDILSDDQQISNKAKYARIDVIPEDQKNLNDNELLIPIMTAYVGGSKIARSNSTPVFMRVNENTTIEEIKLWIKKQLKVSDKDFSCMRLFIAGDQVKASPNSALENNKIVKDLTLKDGIFVIFSLKEVFQPTVQKRNERELKIDN